MRHGNLMKASRSWRPLTGVTATTAPLFALGDETVFSADSSELLQRLLYLLRGVSGHAAGAQDGLVHVHSRVDGGVGVYALFKKRLPEHHRAVLIAHVDGHDGRLRLAGIEAEAVQPLAPLVAQLLQAGDDLRLTLQDVQGGQGGGR